MGNRFRQESAEDRARKYFSEGEPNDCWLWQGAVASGSKEKPETQYGYISVGGRAGGMVPAHRVVYEMYKGPISEGDEIDHLCRVRRCVNPHHLEAVASRENTRRGLAAKIDERIAAEIKSLPDVARKILMKRYGISKDIVENVRNGTFWRDVEACEPPSWAAPFRNTNRSGPPKYNIEDVPVESTP